MIYTRHGPLLPDGRDMIPRRQKRDGFDDAWVAGGTSNSSADADDNPHLKGKHLFSVVTFEHDILDSLAPRPGELVLNKNSTSSVYCICNVWMRRLYGTLYVYVRHALSSANT